MAPEERRRVLVVDDEDGIRLVLQRLLSRFPEPPAVDVEVAESGEKAMEMLESKSFALILTDFNMGGMDGVVLLGIARERWPETQRMLMTGYTDEQIMVLARERAEAAAVVRKPWNNRDLVALIKSILDTPAAPAAPAVGGVA